MKTVFSLGKEVLGKGPTIYNWQKTLGNHLAVACSDNSVKIFDRHGQRIEEISIPGKCVGLNWNENGDTLAVIADLSPTIFLWDANWRRPNQLDSTVKDKMTFLIWAKTIPVLAVGTAKGNLLLYNQQTSRKIHILGKHNNKITCGAWSSQNLLALGSDDNTLSISDLEGVTLLQKSICGNLREMHFSTMKTNDQSQEGEKTVSLLAGKKTLILLNIDCPDDPIELAFQQNYGSIVCHHWYGDGYIIIGFSLGDLVVISTHPQEIGREIFHCHDHNGSLISVAVTEVIGKVATCGNNCIKIHDLAKMNEIDHVITLDSEPKGLGELQWVADGHLLAVATQRGALHVFLARLPQLGAACGTRIAHLTSLREVTICSPVEEEPSLTLEIDIEPSIIGAGPDHVAVCLNNRVWFYAILENGNVQPLKEQEYNGTVKAVSLNDKYAAVAFEGKVQLHTIEDSIISASWEHKTLLLPVRENVGLITSHALTPEFLIYATDAGFICYFILEDWQLLTDFQHEVGIQWLFPDPLGTQLAFMDASGNGYIYSPVKKIKVEIPNVSSMHGILWDIALSSRTIFVAFNKENVFTYAFHKNAIIGPRVILAGSSKLQFNHNPLLLYNGELTCQAESTHLDSVILKSHPFLEVQKVNSASKVELSHMFTQSLMLLRFADTWPICERLQLQSNWNHFAQAAIYHGELDIASQVYRRMGDAAMVLALQDAKGIEEKNLQAGHIAALLSDFDLAQTLYLSSSDPLAALMLRCDLQHWENAIQLAKHLAPQQIPLISKEYASQLEFTGDYVNAIKYYEEGMKEEKHEDHINACNAGLARSSLHVGNVRHGVDLALTHPSQSVQRDCAAILKDMKQFFDAGLLYEMSQNFDKAASMYIRCKNWAKVGDILRQITSPKILLQYAKAKEADCSYKEAAEAYEKAKDHDNHIRMLLEHLGQPEAAMRVAQQNHSLTGAKMVARFLLKLGDYSTAIHFLAMSQCGEEAFQLAQKHGQMETYAEIIGPNATTEELQSIALHFEEENKHHLAGKFFLRSRKYAKGVTDNWPIYRVLNGSLSTAYLTALKEKSLIISHISFALKHFLSYHTGEDHSSLDLAIETISLAKDEVLKSQLIDYLMGETDGIPKDAHYLFRLYMALDQHEEAARTAIIITREEQAQGNYRSAHDMLFSMYQTLGAQRAPAEMAANLLLLHSYVLVKVHIKIGNHLKGAHLLMRVAKNISKFPMHVVPILTSTVIECHRARLHMSAFSYASMLMRPEYRNKIDAKYSKRIEAVVRRPNSYELEENNSPCPFCNHSVPNNELFCPACKNNIPYCIASGQHMVRDNWSICPHCNFPACYSEFTSLLETESTCPMCSQALIPEDIHLIADPTAYLQAIGTHD